MMLDEQDKFIQHIMANRDAEMVAVAESTTSACCKGNLTNLRRELHLSLAKGNPKRTL
jgi:hypothetical protein